jgi:hypothetical protein
MRRRVRTAHAQQGLIRTACALHTLRELLPPGGGKAGMGVGSVSGHLRFYVGKSLPPSSPSPCKGEGTESRRRVRTAHAQQGLIRTACALRTLRELFPPLAKGGRGDFRALGSSPVFEKSPSFPLFQRGMSRSQPAWTAHADRVPLKYARPDTALTIYYNYMILLNFL